ncbi:bifunctional serine/threonine-protein kinase/ABC transporter substrate-binding protein [Microcoleus sp. ARI1-B5]|uniref:bifunctional serine/threonine-protein kinase/ABC transporter substrate-binding protein n=1 Tax=unclassified Microcoleus TaxID=2642155 RepID=UPI002FD4BAB2
MCLNPGDILRDRYQIIDILGEGGFATTYKAYDLKQPGNPLCVVKEIKPPQSTDTLVWQDANQRFQREVEALRLLGHHSRIPEYYQSFSPSPENRNFYLVQEYIEGNPLSQELATEQQWTEEKTIAFLRDLLEILRFVHQNRVIHRDLKPSNLIRKRDGKIVLIDFGAVKEISSLEITESGQTRTRTIYTAGYAPPEQMHGNPQVCSDIYAVGIIAIQAVTGLRPARDLLLHPQGYIVWHYSTPDRPIAEISRQLETVLNKMVSYGFGKRYQSAVEVLQDLQLLAVSRPPHLEVQQPVNNAIVEVEDAIARDSKPPIPSNPPLVLPDGLSAGEKILLTSSAPWLKQRGVKEFASVNSKKAFNSFKDSWQREHDREHGKDPETLVYINNAFLDASNAPYYTIAVALPLCWKNPANSYAQLGNQAKEFLRGVAQAQTEVNLELLNSRECDFPGRGFLLGKSIKGKGLKVIIADDANDAVEAQQRAISLVERSDILAVVGHASSAMTMHVVDIYNDNNLVLMSPGAATKELTDEPKKYFFRTQYTTSFIARDLADYLLEQNQRQVAILYNPGSPFGASFVEDYKNYFLQDAQGGTIVRIRDYDISRGDFNAARAIEEIQANGETAIVLVPDPHLAISLNNAFEIIGLNADRNWIVGAWTLMFQQMLEFLYGQPQKLFKKVIFSVGWHPLNSQNQKFPQQARSLWGEEPNTCTASGYDAARAIVKALKMQPIPSREGMQKMLSSPNFKAWGATGIIQFNSPKNGDRKNPPTDLAHIVECPQEPFGLAFVPVKYATAKEAGLKCD